MLFPPSSQLPFSLPQEEERVGTGSTSEVYKVVVEPGHFQYKEKNNRNYDVSTFSCQNKVDCLTLMRLLFLYLDHTADHSCRIETAGAGDGRENV